MKVWKLSNSKYALKKYFKRDQFSSLLKINGVTYNESDWRIEFEADVLAQVEEVLGALEVVKGTELLKRLYRISKYKPRRDLMRYAVEIYEYRDYIYFILQDQVKKVVDEHEGVFLSSDPKVKQYAAELKYFNRFGEELKSYQRLIDELSIKDIIRTINEKKGSFLEQDPDSAPFLFLQQYKGLQLSPQQINSFFKQELKQRDVSAFQLEKLAELRGVSRQIWQPIFEEAVAKEIKQRLNRLRSRQEKTGIKDLFSKEQTFKLAKEIEQLLEKSGGSLEEFMPKELLKHYTRKKEEFLNGGRY